MNVCLCDCECHCVCEWDCRAVSAGWWDTLLEKVLPQYRAV